MEEIQAPMPAEYFMKKSKNFIFTSNSEKKFSIIFETLPNSGLSITAIEEKYHKKFSKNYSLNSLKSNNYFSSLDTVDEIFDEIINKINYKSPNIEDNSNSLKIVIETFHSKYKEITFYLEEKEKDINDKIEELYSLINKLKVKEKEQDEKIKKLEEKINQLEKKNNGLEQENIRLITSKESIILSNNDYGIRLKNWINPNKTISFSLLYRMSRDGDSIKDFHKLCDKKVQQYLYIF